MISEAFHTVLVEPFYNLLVFILSVLPSPNVGVAIILLTVLVRLLFLPIFTKTIKTQILMKKLEPELEEIRTTFKKDAREQGLRMMELYRKYGVNPLSSLFAALIQIPVFLALYFVFLRGGFPDINQELLYSFIKAPEAVGVFFLGYIDLTTAKHITLALAAGLSQYAQVALSPMGAPMPKPAVPNFKDDFARSFRLQLKYGLPVMIAIFGYTFTGAVALYWVANNVVAILQELFIRKRVEAKHALQEMAKSAK